jgi:hypothetical protein
MLQLLTRFVLKNSYAQLKECEFIQTLFVTLWGVLL